MDQQTFQTSLQSLLKNKATDNSTYRKALTIYESITQSGKQIPNFSQNYANSDSNFALFVFGSAYKLLFKDDPTMKHNLDSILLIIHLTIPKLNTSAIKSNGILQQLQNKVFQIIKHHQGEDKTPLMIRFAVSILSYTLVNIDKMQSNKKACQILCDMFEFAVGSHRTNIISKQSSKMLVHLIKDNSQIAKILSRYANMHMLSNMENHLYLYNVRQVIAEFPMQLINDICYRLCKSLANIQITNEDQETYLAQTYFFLQKISPKLNSSTLEQICKQLVANTPNLAKSEDKVFFCYIQALHSIFQSLFTMNERTANKYLSSVISTLQQFVVKGGKTQKLSYNFLRSIMGNCIRKSLWIKNTTQQDFLSFDMQLQQKKGSNFSKTICLLQSMLSQQFPNFKATASVLSAFFQNLDKSAFQQVLEFIDKIITFRDNFDNSSFKEIMHSVFGAFSIQAFCEIYKLGVEGDIADQKFQTKNNLWFIYAVQKYSGQQKFQTFMVYFYPLLTKIKTILANPNLTHVRLQAYKSLYQMIWRCFKIFCRIPKSNQNYDIIIESIKNQVPEASDSLLDHISMGIQNLCNGLRNQQYQCKCSGNLISLLAKNLKIQKNNSKQILRAMKYLSFIADKDYLNRVFDKNIIKLIQQKQKSSLTSQSNMQTNLKNIQILIAISSGVDFHNPAVVVPYKISRQQLVVKLISDLICQNNIFQKKAYKYIFQVLGSMPPSFMKQVSDLLQSYQHKIMAASKHYRLAILMYMWQKLSQNESTINQAFEFMKKYLPQVLMNMRDSNQRSKRQANALFESFCNKITQMELMESFVEIMCAGLAIEGLQTKISTLGGLALIYQKKYVLPIQFSLGILQIVLMLLYERRSEIYKAVLDFCRRFIFSLEKGKQSEKILNTILQQLFKSDIQSKLQNRCILKHFLIKLSKRFGRQNVQKYIPGEDRKILSNALKTDKRQKKKKKQKQRMRRQQMQRLKNEQKQSSDQQQENQQVQQNEGDMDIEEDNQQNLKQLNNVNNLLLKYDLEKQNFHFQEDKLQFKNKKSQQNKRRQQNDISFEDGLMVVRQDSNRRIRERRKQDQDQKEDQDNAPEARSFLNVRKKRKLNQVHQIKQSGSTFRSDRAGGDVRLKDKPQPHAFIQFNSKALNKRFKKRAEKVFDTIFERHQGGLKGIKAKMAHRGH